MPKLVKIAFIAVVAALAISATRLIPHDARGPGMSAYSESSPFVSPMDMMKAAGALPETKVEDYY